MWFGLILYTRPYASGWDTALSGALSFTLIITLVSGVCMRLYELTLDGADEYQRNAFGVVLIASIVVCLIASIAVVFMSTECLRDRTVALCHRSPETKESEVTKTPVVVELEAQTVEAEEKDQDESASVYVVEMVEF